MTHWNYLDC